MNKILLGLALLMGLSYTASAAPLAYKSESPMPVDKDANVDENLEWNRPAVIAQGGVGTTCNLAYAGKGVVKSANVWSPAASRVVLYDSAAVGSLSAATVDTTKVLAILAIDTTKYRGDFQFFKPIPFVSGLVVCPADANAYSITEYFKQY
jgi:hypothetical protein